MASVSSLDADVQASRLSRYTPAAAAEARRWIEDTLGTPLAPGDLLEALRDGVALCSLANLALAPLVINFKRSGMPFIQMENISHFLRACEAAPLRLPAHDRFLTVDLFESKDPAQVLQCLAAFSRQAHALKPAVFRTTIGPRKGRVDGGMAPSRSNGGGVGMGSGAGWRGSMYGRPPSPSPSHSPTRHSAAIPNPTSAMPASARAMSPSLTGGSTGSHSSNNSAARPSGPVSSWSSRKDEGVTSPAWNIHQYGYMGGASQGNQGISFGARRQITSQGPAVPSLAEKERLRKQKAEEVERLRLQAEEAELARREARQAEEAREAKAEEERWEEEARRQREEERKRVDEQKRQWAEEERRWKEEEDRRREREGTSPATNRPPEKPRVASSGVLRGQTLSQYQKEQAALSRSSTDGSADDTPEQRHVRDLERQLEEAKERERLYQLEREDRMRSEKEISSRPDTAQTQTPAAESAPTQSARHGEANGPDDERQYLRQAWQGNRNDTPPTRPAVTNTQPGAQRPLPSQPQASPSFPHRPLPRTIITGDDTEPYSDESSPLPVRPQAIPTSDSLSSLPSTRPNAPNSSVPASSRLDGANRPAPTTEKDHDRIVDSPSESRNDNSDSFPAHTPIHTVPSPNHSSPRISSSRETGAHETPDRHARPQTTPTSTAPRASGPSWAGKSLLEREMERERERQREWALLQAETQGRARDPREGVAEGQSWDVNQYGFVGGDGQNKGSGPGSGIDFGGRRGIVGPRPKGPR